MFKTRLPILISGAAIAVVVVLALYIYFQGNEIPEAAPISPVEKPAVYDEDFFKESIDVIIESVHDEDWKVRKSAARAACRIVHRTERARDALVECLKDPNLNVRRVAAKHLGQVRPDTAWAIAALFDALEDDDKLVLRYAIISINQLNPDGPELSEKLAELLAGPRRMELIDERFIGKIPSRADAFIPALIELAGAEDRSDASLAIKLLGVYGAGRDDVFETLVPLLEDRRRAGRAAQALVGFGERAVPPLSKALTFPDERMMNTSFTRRKAAAKALLKIKPSGIEVLIEAASDTDPLLRRDLFHKIAAFAPEDERVMPILISALEDTNYWVYSGATSVISKLDDSRLAVTGLSRLLMSPDSKTRFRAAYVLARLKDPAPEAIPALVEAIKVEEDDRTRWAFASALANTPTESMPGILIMLKSEDPLAQRAACYTCSRIGAKAIEAVPSLNTIVRNPESPNRIEAARALANFGEAGAIEAVPALIDIVRNSDWPTYIGAADILASFGEAGADGIPYILDRLAENKGNPTSDYSLSEFGKLALPATIAAVREGKRHAGWVLTRIVNRIGAEAPEATPYLIEMLDDPELNSSAIYQLGRIGPGASDAVPALTRFLRSENSSARLSAAWAIGHMGPAGAKTIRELALLLADDEPKVRKSAVLALKKIGPDAAEILPELRILAVSEPEENTREAREACNIAAVAVAEISPNLDDAVAMLRLLLEKGPSQHLHDVAAEIIRSGTTDREILNLAVTACTDNCTQHEISEAAAIAEVPWETFLVLLDMFLENPVRGSVLSKGIDSRGRREPRAVCIELLGRSDTAAGRINWNWDIFDVVVEMCGSENAAIRARAIDELPPFELDNQKRSTVVRVLSKASFDESAEIRRTIAWKMHRQEWRPSNWRNILFTLSADEDPSVRAAAIRSMLISHLKGPEEKELYSKAIGDENARVVENAFRALWCSGTEDVPEFGHICLELARHPDPGVREEAVYALGWFISKD